MGEILNLLVRADPVSICVIFGIFWALDRRMNRIEVKQASVAAKLEELLRAHQMRSVNDVAQTRP